MLSRKVMKRSGGPRVMQSNVVLAYNPASWQDEAKQGVVRCLAWRLHGALETGRYVVLTADVRRGLLAEAMAAIAGRNGRSVSAGSTTAEYVTLGACVPKNEEPEISFKLHSLGVERIVTQEPSLVTGTVA